MDLIHPQPSGHLHHRPFPGYPRPYLAPLHPTPQETKLLFSLIGELRGHPIDGWKEDEEEQNLTSLLASLEKEDSIRLPNLSLSDILAGQPEAILDLLWSIIYHFQVEEHEPLLRWANATSVSHRGPPVNDFTTSFTDGRVLVALLTELGVDVDDESSNERRWQACLLKAEKLGVPRLLRAGDVHDERSVMAYVSMLKSIKDGMEDLEDLEDLDEETPQVSQEVVQPIKADDKDDGDDRDCWSPSIEAHNEELKAQVRRADAAESQVQKLTQDLTETRQKLTDQIESIKSEALTLLEDKEKQKFELQATIAKMESDVKPLQIRVDELTLLYNETAQCLAKAEEAAALQEESLQQHSVKEAATKRDQIELGSILIAMEQELAQRGSLLEAALVRESQLLEQVESLETNLQSESEEAARANSMRVELEGALDRLEEQLRKVGVEKKKAAFECVQVTKAGQAFQQRIAELEEIVAKMERSAGVEKHVHKAQLSKLSKQLKAEHSSKIEAEEQLRSIDERHSADTKELRETVALQQSKLESSNATCAKIELNRRRLVEALHSAQLEVSAEKTRTEDALRLSKEPLARVAELEKKALHLSRQLRKEKEARREAESKASSSGQPREQLALLVKLGSEVQEKNSAMAVKDAKMLRMSEQLRMLEAQRAKLDKQTRHLQDQLDAKTQELDEEMRKRSKRGMWGHVLTAAQKDVNKSF